MAGRNDDRGPFDRLFRDAPEMQAPFGAQGFGGGAYGYGGYGDTGYFTGPRPAGPRDSFADERRPSYRGRAPLGYQRSDERLREIICEKLTADTAVDPSDISIDVKNREVVLAGTVKDRAEKYHVEELVDRCGGVRDIDNRLKLRSLWRGDAASSDYTRPGNNAQDDERR